MRPAAVSEQVVRHFVRGRESPRGVVWFGARSFWGHLRHLVSAAIASESVDSRDWMTPDEPAALRARIVELLGGDPAGASLTEGLGRDVYVDFVADTGDDVAVSRAVARLVFAPYELPDPDRPGAVPDRAARGHPLLRRRHRVPGRHGAGDPEPRHRPLEPGARGAARRRPPSGAARHPGEPRLVRRPGRVRAHVSPPPARRRTAGARGRRVAADAAAVRGLGARVPARRCRRQTRGAGAVGLRAGAEREPLRFPARPPASTSSRPIDSSRRSIPASASSWARPTGPRPIRRRSS